MADRTGIAWTDATWNPVRGCTRESEGCRFCYAEKVAARFSDPGQAYHGYAERDRPGSKWTGKVDLVPSALLQPLRWQRPRAIFVNSMSDLFHPDLSDRDIGQVFGVMALAYWHTMQVLTKRPDRMLAWLQRDTGGVSPLGYCLVDAYMGHPPLAAHTPLDDQRAVTLGRRGWPLPHVHLGTSAEHQDALDERAPFLRACPATLRFLSCEPLLGPLDLSQHLAHGEIGWVIVGGESGPGARPMRREWAEDIRDQCAAAGVPFFFKQTGSNRFPEWGSLVTGKGDTPAEWPPGLQVQQLPRRPIAEAAA